MNLNEEAPVDTHAEVSVDPQAFRAAMGAVATPVSIVTTTLGVPHGTTVSAFASLSLDPPMVLVSLQHDSDLLELITRSGRFGLNVLAFDQAGIASTFARRGLDRFAGVNWVMDQGLPRIAGIASWAACQVVDLVRAGDHTIVTGLVGAADSFDVAGLVYQHRRFGHFTPVEPAA
ncbi:flavin reductase family protein [Arthrobacter sp. zg-ZUI100]|uniref:Flavin reductase family protein n=1 Tax=Arthrobacter jiangjiafuii TaxID=2817475 RepID=A0A975M4J4_9MICC|nr:flavin reductase family protein [Arthrobacter jiangjiafuii]MBP3035388.1 flavin reductase family protein [Arthrobacter jiangjiafuii]MBP3042412.1 flavin reductase family protein [Arthrobacter jiangjiafuii]QWC09838.1 flavin reductase family protein [Arthrobacter jiangjiafuii]